ncbi:HNH endonuclease [Erythrobacter rubeus]|uniref:HNH endonuclease n=1 Tax=Erythrobacter rubeus TaxID=2760803 RepID=UPI0038B3A2C8
MRGVLRACAERFSAEEVRAFIHHFDHVTTRSAGGGRTLNNGLLKHQRCNQQRADRPPTGCELIWLEFVTARLAKRPKSFKPTFKGGVRNTR